MIKPFSAALILKGAGVEFIDDHGGGRACDFAGTEA